MAASSLDVPYKTIALRKFSSDQSIPGSSAYTHKSTGTYPRLTNQNGNIVVFTPDANSFVVPLNGSSNPSAYSVLEYGLQSLNIDINSGKEVFSLWIVSPNLELQLKPSHIPVRLLNQWKSLLILYSDLSVEELSDDLPVLRMRRSAFLTLKREKRIECDTILTLLFFEARDNFLNSRYPLPDNSETLKLGAYLILIQEGSYDQSKHSVEWLLHQIRIRHFLPIRLQSGKSLFCVSSPSKRSSLANQLLHSLQIQCTKGHSIGTLTKLFLQACQNLAYYGAVFFRAQVERPSNMFTRMVFGERDRQILVALNSDTLHIMDYESAEIIFTLYHQLYSWQYQAPSRSGEEEFCSIWIEFNSVLEDSTTVAKQLQIFSKQAPLMDSLIHNHASLMSNKNFTPHQKSSGSEPITALRVDQPSQTPHRGEKHFSLYSFSMDGERIENSRVKRGLTSFKKTIAKP